MPVPILPQPIRRWVITSGLLLVPIFAWNAALSNRLPAPISDSAVWGAIPHSLALTENILRILVFAVPFFMPLRISTRQQKIGFALFVGGTLVYFASWLPLIELPLSAWTRSAAGFLAPAYTPAIWLGGLALLGQEFSWGSPCRPCIYAILSALFLAAHITHAIIVYVHSY